MSSTNSAVAKVLSLISVALIIAVAVSVVWTPIWRLVGFYRIKGYVENKYGDCEIHQGLCDYVSSACTIVANNETFEVDTYLLGSIADSHDTKYPIVPVNQQIKNFKNREKS